MSPIHTLHGHSITHGFGVTPAKTRQTHCTCGRGIAGGPSRHQAVMGWLGDDCLLSSPQSGRRGSACHRSQPREYRLAPEQGWDLILPPILLPHPDLLLPHRHLEERQSTLSDSMSMGEFSALLLPSHQPRGCRQGCGTTVSRDLGVWWRWTPPALCLGGQDAAEHPRGGPGWHPKGHGVCGVVGLHWDARTPVSCLNPCLQPPSCPRL